ncbi:peptidoglycan-binding domain-containing protein [Streptomyces sp. NBC_01264]|uniref:peptidoglycan-binding domain-containing protein n=1 Tax=Streptomyces sp. NBC_01264 TaxID=2903804 RepID=UPI00225A3A58|nr:peptidoglycan-binding domain-containing protein [Streptomyces sp. NBC_01264]MCX4779933.1 peptidoglycan-binding protein [Streptomyces sp. NBC_01264]
MLKFSKAVRAAAVTAAALAATALAGPAQAASGVGEIAYGDRGTGVKCVQLALNASNVHAGLQVDGIWGARTETAVRAFQSTNNSGVSEAGEVMWLDVDGIVGPNTGKVMFELIVHNAHNWANTCWANMPT